MRRLLSLLLLVASFSACSGEKLTTGAAQSTINKWAANNGEVTVLGVQDISGQNTAEAQLQFKQFKYKNGLNPNDFVWSGAGKARFAHNNDGSWVLTEVTFTTPLDTFTFHPNIVIAATGQTSRGASRRRPTSPRVSNATAES